MNSISVSELCWTAQGAKSGPQLVRRSVRLGRFADWRAVRRRQGVRSELDASGTGELAGCHAWGALREEAPPVARNRGCGMHLGAAILSSFAVCLYRLPTGFHISKARAWAQKR